MVPIRRDIHRMHIFMSLTLLAALNLIFIRPSSGMCDTLSFTQPTYAVSVLEEGEVGSCLLEVSATCSTGSDEQSLEDLPIEYSLAPMTEELHGNTFMFETSTGILRNRRPLDHEVASYYELIVRAAISGAGSSAVEAVVQVTVLDINDNAPVILRLGLSDVAEIPELSPIDTFVAHLVVTDADSRLNGAVSCTIDNDKFSMQEVYPGEFNIATAQVLDYEEQAVAHITVTCTDHGDPARSSSTSLPVHILDMNDHAPHI